jgi:Ni,Fe-hydrogenase maturation factor
MSGNRRKILVFGNALVEMDSLALAVAKSIHSDSFEFLECDSAENLEQFGKDLIILDVADGIRSVCLVDDISKLETFHAYSLHDFDLTMTLKLLKKIGKIRSVKIIAIPIGYSKEKAISEVKTLLDSI